MKTFDHVGANLEREVGWFSALSPLGIYLRLLVVLTFIFGAVGFFGAWYLESPDAISSPTVTSQWLFTHEYDESLDVIAINWCNAVKAENGTIDDDTVNQHQARFYLTEYNLVKAEYNTRLNNAHEAQLIAPPDVPHSAPTLVQNIVQLGLVGCPAN